MARWFSSSKKGGFPLSNCKPVSERRGKAVDSGGESIIVTLGKQNPQPLRCLLASWFVEKGLELRASYICLLYIYIGSSVLFHRFSCIVLARSRVLNFERKDCQRSDCETFLCRRGMQKSKAELVMVTHFYLGVRVREFLLGRAC